MRNMKKCTGALLKRFLCAFLLFLLVQMTFVIIYLSATRHVWPGRSTSSEQIQRHLRRKYVASPNSTQYGAKTHIGFLKVHKASSTTVQRIFLRFGWKQNLTFVLPPEYNENTYPNVISTKESLTSSNTIEPPTNKSFDILCHHVFYNKDAWSDFLPGDFVSIGTVREPYDLFISMVSYMHPKHIEKIKTSDPIGKYLQNPDKYEPGDPRKSFTNNRMSMEYGLPPYVIMIRHVQAIDAYLQHLDKEFTIVIVVERFDESLVLMKRYLNMSMGDILYTRLNVGSVKRHRRPPDSREKEMYRKFAVFDYALYEFFAEKLNKQIAAEGTGFTEEVEMFKSTRQRVERFCFGVRTTESVTIGESRWNQPFDVSRDECTLMHISEIDFTQAIRKRQYGSATWDWNHRFLVP